MRTALHSVRFFSVLLSLAFLTVACASGAAPKSPASTTPTQTQPAPAPTGTSKPGNTLRIGIVTFLSGAAAAPFGVPARNAAEVLIEQLNAGKLPQPYNQKGIAGLTVQPIFTDENGGADKQVAELRRLVTDEKVDLVIGYISSGDCLAVTPVAEELKALLALFDCGTQQIFEEKSYHYVFRTSGHQVLDSVGAARYILATHPDLASIAGINQNYAWGQDSWNAFKAAMLNLKPGLKAGVEQFPKLYAGEYSAEISALLAAKPDVVHSSFWGGDLESLVIQGIPRGLDKGRTLLLTPGETILQRLGNAVPPGVVVGARGPHGALAPNNDLDRWFKLAYRDRYGLDPAYPAYHMAQAILAIKAAYEKAAVNAGKSPDKEQVIAALENLEFDTPSGMIKLALGKGHQAVEPSVYATTGKYDPARRADTLENIKVFPPECVNPPEGVKAMDWINQGFPGAKC